MTTPATMLPSDGVGTALRAPRTRRPVAASIEELLAGVEGRAAMDPSSHSLSSASFERVVVGGARYVVKHLHPDEDWIMRATGEIDCRWVHLWRSGMIDLLPPTIDATIAGAAAGLGRNGWGAAVLLRDVGDVFTPEGDAVLDREQHERFIEHMADLHVRFWGFADDTHLAPPAVRWFLLSPSTAAAESARRDGSPIARAAGEAWPRVRDVSPKAAAMAEQLFEDVGPLADALAATPTTFIHGDWKFGNLGSHADGRTVLVDWAFPGPGAPCADLAWYLGVNCDRLPETKDDVIDRYRRALEQRGVDTAGWWDTQLGLSAIGLFLQLGWNKAQNGRDDELCWWEERVVDAERYLA